MKVGLLSQDDHREAFEGDEPLFEEQEQQEQEAGEEPVCTNTAANTATSSETKAPLQDNEGAQEQDKKKQNLIEDLVSTVEEITLGDQDDIKIRNISHTCSVAPFDAGSNMMEATRIVVYDELPSGVSPSCCSVVQDVDDPNKVKLTVERVKDFYDIDFFFGVLLQSREQDQNSNAKVAAMLHIKEESTKLEMTQDNVACETFSFRVGSDLKVEMGFRRRHDITVVHNKEPLLSQRIEIEEDDGNIEYANYVFFYLLGWTAAQFEERKRLVAMKGSTRQVRPNGPTMKFGSPHRRRAGANSRAQQSPDESMRSESKESNDSSPGKRKKTSDSAGGEGTPSGAHVIATDGGRW